MAVTATNLILGPGSLHSGEFGAVEPIDTAVATAPDELVWTDVGGTMDGVTLSVAQDYTELEVDQIVDVVGRRLTKRDFTIKTNLAEPTLENLALASNGGIIATGGTGVTAFKSLTPGNDSSATQPNYKALLFDGFAPNSKRRRVFGRRMLSTANTETAYKKGDQTVFTVTFSGHYVSSSIAPYKWVDEVAA